MSVDMFEGQMSFGLLRVLVIDDAPEVSQLFQQSASRFGWDVASAGDGVTGLALARAGVFDVIVLDLRMAGLPGLTVLRLLRSEGNLTPAVIHTGFPDTDSAIEAGQLGAVRYIHKPTQMRIVAQKLREAAELRSAPSARRLVPEPVPASSSDRAAREAFRAMQLQAGALLPGPTAVTNLLNRFIDASLNVLNTSLPQFALMTSLIQQVLADPHSVRAAAEEFMEVANSATLADHRRGALAVRLLAPFAHPLGLREKRVASELGKTSSTVRSDLRDLFGCGFNELRWAALIRPAISPVARTTEPIGSIAISCGCVTLAAERQFHRAWSNALGLTASEFRERCGL